MESVSSTCTVAGCICGGTIAIPTGSITVPTPTVTEPPNTLWPCSFANHDFTESRTVERLLYCRKCGDIRTY